MLSGVYPATSVYSLFSCWACAPTKLLKLVVRWRLSSVFWGGIFSSMASVSELNRGSSICVKGRILRCFVELFVFLWPINSMIMCTHNKPSVHATAPQVWSVLCQVYWPQPLHDSVVGPLDNFTGSELVLNTQTQKHTAVDGPNNAFFKL